MATKYLIFSLIFAGYAAFSYNRKGVSFAIPKLIEEGLSNEQLGLILSSQNLAYAISKFLGGIISDKLSPRLLFSAGLLTSGLAAVLFASVDSVLLYTIVWFLNGLAQGVGWPAIAKLLRSWFDPAELGTWWSMASASANLAGCIAPFIASYIIQNYGWRASLLFVGAITVIAAIVSFIFLLDSPKSASKLAARSTGAGLPTKKVSRPQPSDKSKDDKTNAKSSMRILLAARFIWVISICYMAVSCVKTTFTDWSQLYLMRDCHQSSLVASSFVSSLEFGGFFGGIAAGYLSDLYMRKTLKDTKPTKGHPRMVVGLLFAIITAACLYLFHHHVNAQTPAIFINQLGILVGASVYGQIAILGVVATQSVDADMSGTAHAIAALAANIGSILAGLPVATLAKSTSWSHVFLSLEVVGFIIIIFMILNHNVTYKVASSKKKSL